MRHSRSAVRALSLALLAIATTVTATGCFKRGARGDYALAPEMRPLEVPPDLTLPNTAGASQVPALASAARPAQPAAAQPAQGGFTVSGSRDEVFGKVGDALATVDGVTIASRAQLLGSYDVSYRGESFLVRVAAVQGGSYISAVDPRGVPATSEAAVQVIAALQAALAN